MHLPKIEALSETLVSPEYKHQLEVLANDLVHPERFGGVALTLALLPGEQVEMPLPELARVYDFPTGDSEL